MLRRTLVIEAVCILCSLGATYGVALKQCGSGVEWIPDLDDCSVYYMCVGGTSQRLVCQEGFSFRPDRRVCVPKGSIYDICKPSPCNGRTDRIPHENSCAMYYDCGTTSRIDETWEPRARECPSPYLFSPETKNCEHYRRVNCGNRKEPKSPCDYYINQCRRSHCIPCRYRFASCEGLRNGLHPWPGREGSPYYIGCRQERVLFQRECPRNGAVQIFDPQLKKCVVMNNNYV